MLPTRIPHHTNNPPTACTCIDTNHSLSRQSLKKYVRANNTINVGDGMFDSLFNKALKSGVEKGLFEQPKGMSHDVNPL